ncbi:SCO4848 family membrane protein [Gandjariella thermophila]|uniref:Membrane protein n=1 Tax=Gandjariella thermophila TaxID=1931992 RepID=A0A4D4J382_9PSEU|nr:hypothetical protein [Gandjariella thermophila]GDY29218.1 membrane protein [Gandjariella thermophila]
MKLSRGASLFLLAFAVWSWVIWPNFMRNVWMDPRSWDATGSPTGFFTVHLVLTVVSVALGTAIGVIGVRGLLALHRRRASSRGGGR